MPPQSERPNIIWLLTDHHIFQHHMALGRVTGGLPTYERLCREGISFSRAHTVCPLCTPARASMLTGVYPHRHRMTMNSGAGGARLEFEPDEHLFSHYLREAGYRVGYFGKWHCGVARTALDYGFEGWTMPDYGHPYWSEEYAAYLEELGLPQATVDVEHHISGKKHLGTGIRLRDEPNCYHRMSCAGVLTTPVQTHESCFLNHMAMRWMEGVAKSRDPFVLRVDVWGPHQPYWVGAPYAGTVDPNRIPEYPNFRATLEDRPAFHRNFRDGIRKGFGSDRWEDWAPLVARAYEHATQVDAAFATVLDAVDRLGLADNTLILYTSDHGDILGAQGGGYDKGSLMVEETMRIPMAMRWPGRISPGLVTDRFVSNMDFVPTVLEAAGAEIPSPMDGASLLPLGRDPNGASWREELMCEHYGHGWPNFQRLLRHGPWKYVAHLGDIEELYNLDEDPYELRNLAYRPTLGAKNTLSELRQRLLSTMASHDDGDELAVQLRRQIS